MAAGKFLTPGDTLVASAAAERAGNPAARGSRAGQENPVVDRSISGARAAALGALAALVHGAFDLVTYPSAWTRAPYLRIEDMPELFSTLTPAGVSIAASGVSGVIAALAIVAVEPGRDRRAVTLGVVLALFWLFSALLTHVVWLKTSWALALTSLPLGVPRGLAIGWLTARLVPAPSAARD